LASKQFAYQDQVTTYPEMRKEKREIIFITKQPQTGCKFSLRFGTAMAMIRFENSNEIYNGNNNGSAHPNWNWIGKANRFGNANDNKHQDGKANEDDHEIKILN